MVTLLLDSTRLEVALSGMERALSFHKGNVILERTTIVKVQLVDDAWTWLRGVHAPGTYLRGALAMGTWKSAGASDFVLIRRRRPAIVIDLDGHDEFERVILSTRHGLALVEALRVATGDEPEDVAEIAAQARRRRTRKAAGSTAAAPAVG
ncbi:hypothetical protein CVS47_03050 [Microbacterium lemovicicum]|uniref:Uncharacterized protein n=1 Tax=Microbacterium lemovicicum TaxID=1072463 RepID=A0A3Q9J4S8_9MICO|nr:hypothetical protein [Microbacterium lemovicicum]AZS38393.1 hypothetical protein CVS47_03050 [Microbacterium lemovicicum]